MAAWAIRATSRSNTSIAITAAIAFLKGGTPEATTSYDNGTIKVPAKPSVVITVDKTNDRAEFDCADITWTAINAGTAAQATVLKEITNDAASKCIANIDSGGFPVVTNGGDLTIQVNAEGLIQLSTV